MNDLTVPFDLYRDVHKAIRTSLFDVVVTAGRLDTHDRPARIAHAAKVRDLVRFLVFHAEHEDRHVEPLVQQILPEQAAAINAEHLALEQQMARLVELADLAFECGDDARGAVHVLYLELAAFTARYLAHQDVEERVVMPALWGDAFGFEPLLAVHGAILASITPDDMGWSLAKMLPAMNVDDRTEMLVGMRAGAPAEAFAGVVALAVEVLPAADFRSLSTRLSEVPAPAAGE